MKGKKSIRDKIQAYAKTLRQEDNSWKRKIFCWGKSAKSLLFSDYTGNVIAIYTNDLYAAFLKLMFLKTAVKISIFFNIARPPIQYFSTDTFLIDFSKYFALACDL